MPVIGPDPKKLVESDFEANLDDLLKSADACVRQHAQDRIDDPELQERFIARGREGGARPAMLEA
jgi:hypothetical protein